MFALGDWIFLFLGGLFWLFGCRLQAYCRGNDDWDVGDPDAILALVTLFSPSQIRSFTVAECCSLFVLERITSGN